MKRVRRVPVLMLASGLAGCFSVQGYDGPKREPDEVARISGDPSVNAGSPVTLVLRKVDEHTLNVAQTSVEVLPGKHTLLVDCRILESRAVTRHALEVEVAPGGRYHLTAQTEPGLRGCTDVTLRESD